MGLGILPGISSMAADLCEEASYRIEGHQLPRRPASFTIRTHQHLQEQDFRDRKMHSTQNEFQCEEHHIFSIKD